MVPKALTTKLCVLGSNLRFPSRGETLLGLPQGGYEHKSCLKDEMRDPINQAEPRAGTQYLQLRMVLGFGPGSGPNLRSL